MSRQIRVTVPDNIYKQLEEAAKNNYRSLSNQCLIMLRDGLQYQQLLNPPQFIPHNTPGGIPTIPQPPFEPYATTTSTPAVSPAVSPVPEPQPAPPSEPDNEWYKKIKKGYKTLYGENSPEWQELLHMAARPDVKAFMKTQHRNDVEQIITNSYDHTLDAYQFEELLDYLNRGPRRP